jgi:hypothetical protein
MRSRKYTGVTTEFFALWTGATDSDHDLLVSVYDNENRARQCAEVLGCAVRPVTLADLHAYLHWRRSLDPEWRSHDPLVSLYIGDNAPILPVSGVIARLQAMP